MFVFVMFLRMYLAYLRSDNMTGIYTLTDCTVEQDLLRKISCVLDMNVTVIALVVKYKVVQI